MTHCVTHPYQVIYDIIDGRRAELAATSNPIATSPVHGDLLQSLLMAVDDEGSGKDCLEEG